MITAEQAKLYSERSVEIKTEVQEILSNISNKISENALEGLFQLNYSTRSFANYHISEKDKQVRTQVLRKLCHAGYVVNISGLDSANHAYLVISWGS